ncbi:MAG: hypothetical protein ACKOS8_17955 [Gemmataceae bacterium]
MMDRDDPTPLTPAPCPELPPGFPGGCTIRRIDWGAGGTFDLLLVPLSEGQESEGSALSVLAREWATTGTRGSLVAAGCPGSVLIPLYGSHVVWSPERGAVIAEAGRLETLEAALTEFVWCERRLRELERRGDNLNNRVESDAASILDGGEGDDQQSPGGVAGSQRESISIRAELTKIAPLAHAAAVHPPTAASQLAERLRDRTRLAERHDLATNRADFALQVYEACGQRAFDARVARRQSGLEWAIIVILVGQMALMLVEILSSRTGQ